MLRFTTATARRKRLSCSTLSSGSIHLVAAIAMGLVTAESRASAAQSLPLIATSSSAHTPLDGQRKRESISLDYLMEACAVVGQTAGGMIPYFDCESYIYGILDAELAASSSHGQGRGVCVPVGLAPWEVYRNIGKGIPRSLWSKPAAPLIIQFLRRNHPCTGASLNRNGVESVVVQGMS